MTGDLRYAHVTCATCGVMFQNIDFNCEAHRLMCLDPQREVNGEKVALFKAAVERVAQLKAEGWTREDFRKALVDFLTEQGS